jgi:aspartate/tyrosine/aromatic aminotransferase
MVYAYTQDVPIDTDMYARITDALGSEPMDGLLLHLCVHNPDGGLRYIDVWESEEQCARAFDERVHPAVDAAFGGHRPPGEPTVTRLDVVEARGSAAVGIRV